MMDRTLSIRRSLLGIDNKNVEEVIAPSTSPVIGGKKHNQSKNKASRESRKKNRGK